MIFDKQTVLNALRTITTPGDAENMVDSGALKNVVIFGDEVIVDVTISNPTLQAKKRTEVDIMKTIHDLVFEKAKVQVRVSVDKPAAASNAPTIKGQPIEGIQNIIACGIRKRWCW